MKRLIRIQTIWRKELIDTLRDRRTLIAMIVVPMVLYPAMMLGSLQGFELQVSRLKQEEYKVAVVGEEGREWLRWLLDTDPARRPQARGLPAEEIIEREKKGELGAEDDHPPPREESAEEAARAGVREHPPTYDIQVVGDPEVLRQKVRTGEFHVGLLSESGLPSAQGDGSAVLKLVLDQTDIRSQIAATGLEGVLNRAADYLLNQRLQRAALPLAYIQPIQIEQEAIASPEKVGGSILGQIVPLILVVMTLTGAIYPAIDLTAGERERGTLETLMVAPVPTVDLIAGKFMVVALIAMLTAALNLLSIGGTIYLGGLGDLLTRGGAVVIPLKALPWVLLVLLPLAVMFSAALLAVCSFARSFKEAQNYVMPVMIAALIPAVVGVLPGTRLEGPLLIMPVTNIVILTRDLFTGRFEVFSIVWVMLSTTLYAGAAVAVAAKLFGQEAVLFADSGSIKTVFQRRFLKPADRPGAAQALLLLAAVYSINIFLQQTLLHRTGVSGTATYWLGLAAIIITLFTLLPLAAAAYTRVRIRTAFGLVRPTPAALVAALCFGLSGWILAQAWYVYQQSWLPMPAETERLFEQALGGLREMPPLAALFFMAVVPGFCEEFFFRGYVVSGTRPMLGKLGTVLLVGVAFGIYHTSIHRLVVTTALGVLFGLLVVQFRSIWPAVIAHIMTNGFAVLSGRDDALKPLLDRLGFVASDAGMPPVTWVIGAGALTGIGILICLLVPARQKPVASPPPGDDTGEQAASATPPAACL
jgi:ABC-2 type transport system permease protein/sodium transport system permease protein